MARGKHTPAPRSAKDVVSLILNTDRVMPAYYTGDKNYDRTKSFLIHYEPLGADAEHQMAALIWSEVPKLLDRTEAIAETLYHSLIRLFENYCLAGYILANEKMEFYKSSVLKDLNQFHIHKLNGGKELQDAIERSDVRLALEESYQTGWIEAQKTRFPQAKSLKELKKLSRRKKHRGLRETAKSFGAFAFCLAIGVLMTIFALWLEGPGEKKPSTRMVRVNSQYDAVAYTMEDRRYITIQNIDTPSGNTVDFFACGLSKDDLKESSPIIECKKNGRAYFLEFTEE